MTFRAVKPALRTRFHLAWTLAGLVSYGLFQSLAQFPAAADSIFRWPVTHVPSWLVSRVTGWLPLVVIEWVAIAAGTYLLLWLARGVTAVLRRECSWAHLAAAAALKLAAVAGAYVLAFYAAMGHYFARPPLSERMNLAMPDSVSVPALATVVRALADSTNAAYLRVHDGQSMATATVVTSQRRQRAVAALERAWPLAVAMYSLDAHLGWRHGPPKSPFFSSSLYEHRRPGQYVFITGEALVAGRAPVLQWAKTVAHEQAHQRGVAHEGDANFLAYLVASHADDDLVRYSVSHFAFEQLFWSLYAVDADSAIAAARRLLPGVRADVRERDAYFAVGRDRMAAVVRAANHAYLRAQGVRDGVASYSHSARMILALYLSRTESTGP